MSFQSPFNFPRKKLGWVDDGSPRQTCNCYCGNPYFTTISTHFCSNCGAAVDYWHNLTNKIFLDAQQKADEAWEKQRDMEKQIEFNKFRQDCLTMEL